MDFNVEPYYDDFEGETGAREQNYMRMLFRPGYAVQARELTQIQSILQNQIKSFGDHIFKDGSPVQGGHLTFDNAVSSVFLNASDDYSLSDFSSQIITNSTGGIEKKAVVVAIDDTVESSTVGGALLVRYLTAGTFNNSEQLEVLDEPSITATTVSANSSYVGSVASINEGIFYVDGFFVYVPQQTIVLDSQSTTPTYKIGLEIDDNIIDESTDSNLLDPAQESFNYQAPGATRYQFNLNLTKRALDSEDSTTFFELLRIEEGVITKQVEYPLYSEINKTLARRTDDQSGSFTVRPFRITTSEDDSNSQNYIINIEPGKAYVKGYEFETISTTKFKAPKSRSTSTSIDYDLSMEYGNFLVCTGLRDGSNGFFNPYNFGSVDLHVVPSANVLPNVQYTRTKIGTARIRNVEYAGISGSGSSTYYVYILDANARPLVVNATGGSTSTINLPTNMSSHSNAYNNVSVSIVAGTGASYSGTIKTYNETTKVATVDPLMLVAPDTSSRISLNYGVKDAKSLVMTPDTSLGLSQAFASQNANTAYYATAEIIGRTSAGTTVFETNKNSLIYKLPESYLVRGEVMSGITFRHRKYISDVTFTSGGSLTLTSGISYSAPMNSYEKFVFGGAGIVSGVTANENVLLMIKDKLTSNLRTGDVITFGSGANNITSVSDEQIVINTSASAAFKADIFITVEIEGANSVLRRSKTLAGNSSITTLRSTDSQTNGTNVTGATNTKLDSSNAHVWFTGGTQLSNLKVPGTKQSLYTPDVFKILGIYDSGSTTYSPNVSNAIDVTNRYVFESGQRDNYYDHASLSLRQGSQPPAGQIVVLMQYYQHSGSGFFNVDSYSQTAYDNNLIPFYASEKSGIYALRDCIDFRPTRTAGTTAFTLSGTYLPYPYFNMEIEQYQFYLPRIDKLVLTTEGEFKLLQGEASAYPKVPADLQNSMTLYKLSIPPYTIQAREIPIEYVDNRRYTMKDIGALKSRIENLEYYTSLNLLETLSARQAIYGLDGIEKAKLGFLADQFDGYNIADSKSIDLVCNMSKNELSPYKVVQAVGFDYTSGTGSIKKNQRTVSLSYTETAFVSQLAASNTVSVQPYEFASFTGNLFLTPESDYWYSTGLVPEIVAAADNNVKRELPGDNGVQTPIAGTTNPVTTTPTITFQTAWSISDPTLNIPADLTGFGIIDLINWTALNQETKTESLTSQTQTSQVPVNSGGSLNLEPGGGVIGIINEERRSRSGRQ
jgi:hypothetical protein